MLAQSKNICMFAFDRSKFRVIVGPIPRGHFLCSIQYGGGPFTSRKGDPEQGSVSVNGHRFFIGLLTKTCLIMNKPTLGLLTPEQIISDLLLSDDMQNLRKDLRLMVDCYLLHEDERHYRKSVHASFLILDMILAQVENIQQSETSKTKAA